MTTFERIGVEWKEELTPELLRENFDKEKLDLIVEMEQKDAVLEMKRLLEKLNVSTYYIKINDCKKFSEYWSGRMTKKLPEELSGYVNIVYIRSVPEYAIYLDVDRFLENTRKNLNGEMDFAEKLIPGYRLKNIFNKNVADELSDILFRRVGEYNLSFSLSYTKDEMRRIECDEFVREIKEKLGKK